MILLYLAAPFFKLMVFLHEICMYIHVRVYLYISHIVEKLWSYFVYVCTYICPYIALQKCLKDSSYVDKGDQSMVWLHIYCIVGNFNKFYCFLRISLQPRKLIPYNSCYRIVWQSNRSSKFNSWNLSWRDNLKIFLPQKLLAIWYWHAYTYV